MIVLQLNELALLEAWQETDPPQQWKVQFPLMGMPGTESLGSVYFELEPGQSLPTHADSRDEIVVVLSGSGMGTVGDETTHLSASGLAFIPAMVPHSFRNTGDDTLRAIGVFAGAAVVSTFEQEVMPEGLRVFGLDEVPDGA